MLGAIIGDIVGSRFEFNNFRSKDFDLFNEHCFFTDDTVMTCAVAKSVLNLSEEETVKNMKKYGEMYPNRGYGASFSWWLNSFKSEPYYSYGNGAAMRVSPIAYIAKNEEDVKRISKIVTGVTHNHPEGLKGAEVTAMCVFYALNGVSKQGIFDYAVSQYPILKEMSYEDLKKNYYFNETCQNTVPQAIYCFFISNSFEDCLRTSISIGGDSDTLSAISCSIAEACYGIPKSIIKKALSFFTEKDKKELLEPLIEIYKNSGINNYIVV